MRKSWLVGAGLAAVGVVFAVMHAGSHRAAPSTPALRPPRAIVLQVTDGHAELPCRVHLKDDRGKPVEPPGFPFFHDHFVFSGRAELRLPPGHYDFEIERGPEYGRAHGGFVVPPEAGQPVRVELARLANLAERGWYSGELHIHRRAVDAELLLRAEDLHVGAFVTWWNDEPAPTSANLRESVQRFAGEVFVDPTGGEDERQGGALLFFGLERALALPHLFYDEKGRIAHRVGAEADEVPSTVELAREARAQGEVHLALEKPFWWDTPTWVALGLVDSVGIAHNHMDRELVRNHEAWGKPCDRAHYGSGPFANAYCTQDIYYALLDSGFRLAPSAGSASGVLPNPVGYDRVYVKTGMPLTVGAWWRDLTAGHSFVTNGPLLIVAANGEAPGAVFHGKQGERAQVSLTVELTSADPIAKVELVRDGAVAATGVYDAASHRVTFAPQTFERSGWFLVRAIAARQDTFRFASTAPFYVELEPAPRRISKRAVEFFRAWLAERIDRIEKSGLSPEKAAQILPFQHEAGRVWDDLLARANAD